MGCRMDSSEGFPPPLNDSFRATMRVLVELESTRDDSRCDRTTVSARTARIGAHAVTTTRRLSRASRTRPELADFWELAKKSSRKPKP